MSTNIVQDSLKINNQVTEWTQQNNEFRKALLNTNESPKSTIKKKIKKPKCRTNVHVSNSQRMQLLDLIHNRKHTITKAAQIANIKYENAKLINKIYI